MDDFEMFGHKCPKCGAFYMCLAMNPFCYHCEPSQSEAEYEARNVEEVKGGGQ